MTDKEFRRLSRADLIEIIYTLQQSERSLQEENDALREKLEERRVAVEQSGSLAEVLAKLNGLFEAAQATADGYRDEAKAALEEAQQTRAQADEYLTRMKQQAVKLARLTMKQRDEMLAKAEEECKQLREQSRRGQSPVLPSSQKQRDDPRNLDALLHSAKEGCSDGDSEG